MGARSALHIGLVRKPLSQSIAWAGLIKVSSNGSIFLLRLVIGILSISYLVGDAAARSDGGSQAKALAGARCFYFAAIVAGLCSCQTFCCCASPASQAGHTEAKTNPLNLFADSAVARPQRRELLLPLLRSRSFLIVCFLSLGCTIIRESFNTWLPVYLHDYLGYTASNAAGMSAIFPGVGAVSVLASGWLSDRLGANGRSVIMLVGLAATAAALLASHVHSSSAAGSLLPLIAIGAIAFCLLGPYSYLGGAFALDFGGKQASAVSSGIIDGVGYLGAVAAGDSVASSPWRSAGRGCSRARRRLAFWPHSARGILCYLSAKAAARKARICHERADLRLAAFFSRPDH